MRFLTCRFIVVLWCFVAVLTPAFAAEPNRDEQLIRIEKAIATGAAFLAKEQNADGTWRSRTYGLLKDGTSLTPLVLLSLAESAEANVARERGCKAIARWVQVDGQSVRITTAAQYPIYTAGLCLQFQCNDGSKPTQDAIIAWSSLLLQHQLNQQNGWSVEDSRFGGWSYSHEAPKKPEPGVPLSPLDEPNLSATVFALEGLLAADPEGRTNIAARRMALRFVQRCQNFHETSSPNDARFNDGGFHFMLGDEVRNKPGVAGIDTMGETRFVSYGSATADGLRALLLCGMNSDHPRVLAATKWLSEHFDDGSHPGTYPAERRHLQASLDFYYAASLARTLRLASVDDDRTLGHGRWVKVLAEQLIRRQRADGSWSNPAVDVREDDPLIATPLALRALTICRDELQQSR